MNITFYNETTNAITYNYAFYEVYRIPDIRWEIANFGVSSVFSKKKLIKWLII